jgi:hypothetical protein
MKTKYTVLASAILMGASLTIGATPSGVPGVPAPYANGPLTAPYYAAPNLLQPEKAVFAALEGAMQEGEAFIFSTGCPSTPKTLDITAQVDLGGYGFVELISGGVTQVHLDVAPGAPSSVPPGTLFNVTGSGNNLFGNALPGYSGAARYSGTGQMMTLGASFQSKSINNAPESLSGLVIKDFYKANAKGYIPVIYDWGLQSVHKNTIPQDKWWQRSVATRSDNATGRTIWWKDRLFSAKNGGVCNIKIDMSGQNDADGFFQDGTFVISKTKPAP